MRYGMMTIFCGLLLCRLAIAQPSEYPDSYPPPDTTSEQQDSQALDREEISGTVESIHGHAATILTDDGERVDVNLGPQSYWRAHGYYLSRGMPVRVAGWRAGGGVMFAGEIWGPDIYIQLTDSEGFPLWVNSDEYWPGWYPTWPYFSIYFDRPPLYRFGFGPWWYFGPYYRHGPYFAGRHYYARPYGPHFGGHGYGGRGHAQSPRGGRRGH